MDPTFAELAGSTDLPAEVETELIRRLKEARDNGIPRLGPSDWWAVLVCLVLSAVVLVWGYAG
jgi:nicotinamidase-related amidase